MNTASHYTSQVLVIAGQDGAIAFLLQAAQLHSHNLLSLGWKLL